jgi:hypothetical protein
MGIGLLLGTGTGNQNSTLLGPGRRAEAERVLGFTGLYLVGLLSDLPFVVVSAILPRCEWRRLGELTADAPAAPSAAAAAPELTPQA